MTGLRLVTRTGHDLPPRWDGRPVEWRGWDLIWSTARFHLPKEVCTGCGSDAEQPHNVGLVHPLPGDTVEAYRIKKLPSGRTYDKKEERRAHATYRLVAFRCPDCHLDTLLDRETDETWTLDSSDYGDEGSTDPRLF